MKDTIYSNTFFNHSWCQQHYIKRRYFSCSSYMYSRQKITFMQFTVIMQIVLNLCASFVFIFYSNKIDDIRNMISCRNKSVSCIIFKYYSFSNTHVLNKCTNRKWKDKKRKYFIHIWCCICIQMRESAYHSIKVN